MDPNAGRHTSQQPAPSPLYVSQVKVTFVQSVFHSALSNCICFKLIILYPEDIGMGEVPRALECFLHFRNVIESTTQKQI